jgi:hypothetical protein
MLTICNAGRAGYGASLEGMVRMVSMSGELTSEKLVLCFCSGLTPMMPATLELHPIKL